MLGLSRWSGTGRSYRTIQRFYATGIPWAQVLWQFFCQTLFRKEETYLLAGDECVDSKAGKKAYGLDHFFSGPQQKVIPWLSFFVFSLVSVNQRHAYTVYMEQTVRSAEEKAACKVKRKPKKPEPPDQNANRADRKAARIKRRRRSSAHLSCSAFSTCSKRCWCGCVVSCDRPISPWRVISAIIRHFPWSVHVACTSLPTYAGLQPCAFPWMGLAAAANMENEWTMPTSRRSNTSPPPSKTAFRFARTRRSFCTRIFRCPAK